MASVEAADGVIKFTAEHRFESLGEEVASKVLDSLQAWRHILYRLDFVGQDPDRYDGAGFGNMSARVSSDGGVLGGRAFLVTGTQTGAQPRLDLSDYCVVEKYDTNRNRVESKGETMPSSESLTHGAVYDLDPAIRFVFHGHIPRVWRQAESLGIPISRPEVAYGTPDMAQEMARLYSESSLGDMRIMAMGGHEDGVLSFGEDADQAGSALVSAFSRALRSERVPTGG